MADFPVTFDEASIVLLGSFNPAILHPSWFARVGLLANGEADEASLEICMNEITRFSLPWLHLEATGERLTFKCSDTSHFALLRDIVIGMRELLPHTPIKKLGINRTMHFDVLDDATWHRVGHAVAPKAIWESILDSPGLKQMTIEGKRTDGLPGIVNMTIQPVLPASHRVAIGVNDHYDLDDNESTDLLKLLRERWDESLKKSEVCANSIIRKAAS